jgi:hypothetical protein
MRPADVVLASSLDDLGHRLDRGDQPYARINLVDGRQIQGMVLDVGEAGLIIADLTSGAEVPLASAEIHALEINSPRRVREWLLALCAIPIVTALLVAFSRLQGREPTRRDIAIGVGLGMAIVWALGSIPGLRKLFHRQLTTWVRVYPP